MCFPKPQPDARGQAALLLAESMLHLLVEAGVLPGKTLTSWPSLQTDIRNAGGTWVDEEVFVCPAGPNTLVSSRNPDDLPAFCAALVEVFADAQA